VPDLLRFSVLTPDRTLLDVANVSKVRLKLADGGWLSVYPRHEPLLGETLAGLVTYITESGEQTISLSESILQVTENDVTLFTGGELTASAAVMGETEDEDATDATDAHFDRLARVLMVSLQALPPETLGDLESERARA
jgi:F0F1-type ATP synthase epsilon subunit